MSSFSPSISLFFTNLSNRLHPLRTSIGTLMDSLGMTLFVVFCNVLCLTLGDFRVWLAPPSADNAFVIVLVILVAIGLLELAARSATHTGYFVGFCFWIDLCGIISLLPDITPIWCGLTALPADALTSTFALSAVLGPGSDVMHAIVITKSLNSLQRLTQFVRLVRLVRIAKLFELWQRRRATGEAHEHEEEDKDRAAHDSDSMSPPPPPSQVGAHLAEQTTRKVVLLVLLMLFGIPLLQPSWDGDHAEEYTVAELAYMAQSNSTLGDYSGTVFQPQSSSSSAPVLTSGASIAANNTMSNEVAWVLQYYSGGVLYMRILGPYASYEYVDQSIVGYRFNEVNAVQSSQSIVVFSVRSGTKTNGAFSLLTTLVILSLLGFGAALFHRNNHRMVIVPIERMMSTIVALQRHPLARASASHNAANAPGDGASSSAGAPAGDHSRHSDHNNETGLLERTLEKLTGLLQVGFGEAGSRMIQKCMSLNADGDLDPLVDGTRMLAIFGFCDIRRFTDATECLREDVMLYVNEIAAIVHNSVAECDGSPNKNIGDAFLLVWRLPSPGSADLGARAGAAGAGIDADDLFQLSESQPIAARASLETLRRRAVRRLEEAAITAASSESLLAPSPMPSSPSASTVLIEESLEARSALWDRAKKSGASLPPIRRTISPALRGMVAALADKALVAFLRIMVEIGSSAEIKRYADHPRIRLAFDNFTVQLGFGLHAGWAIEGPIGSRCKIDASYLSPHVNLSETLQDCTKIYGVPILLSGEFHALLSPFVQSMCRRVDVARVGGREAPVNLYTFDIHKDALKEVVADRNPVGYDEFDYDYRKDEEEKKQYDDEYDSNDVVERAAMNELAALNDQRVNDTIHHPPSTSPHPTSSLILSPSPSPDLIDSSSPPPSSTPSLDLHPTFLRRTSRQPPPSAPALAYHMVRRFHLRALQAGIPPLFHSRYAAGLDQYIAGDWTAATASMKDAAKIYPADGTTKVILQVMQEHKYVALKEWQGWHEV